MRILFNVSENVFKSAYLSEQTDHQKFVIFTKARSLIYYYNLPSNLLTVRGYNLYLCPIGYNLYGHTFKFDNTVLGHYTDFNLISIYILIIH